MKQLLVVVTLLFLAACGGVPQAATPQPTDVPLLTDEDVDNAQLLLSTNVKELVGIEGRTAPAGQEVEALASAPLSLPSELSPQTLGLPDPNTEIYYIQKDSTPTNAPVVGSLLPGPTFYSILVKNTNNSTGRPEVFYSGAREVQSIYVVFRGDGVTRILVSMRETTNPTSDFEIFEITRHSDSLNVTKFTSDNVDNINVTEYNRGLVWEETVLGKATIVILEGSTTIRLNSPYSQRHPAYIRSLREIVFVRDLPNGYDSIVKYSLASNTYSTLVDTTPINARALAPVTLDFPSVSYQGNKVLWLENGRTVKLKNLALGTVQTVTSDDTIKRPSLNADGRFITYQKGSDIYFKNLQTAQVWPLTSNASYSSSYVPKWDLGKFLNPQLQVTVTGLPTGHLVVRLISPDGWTYNFGSSRTIGERGELGTGTYTITATSFITNPHKPTCKQYIGTPASQTVTLELGEVKSVSVTYTSEPCIP